MGKTVVAAGPHAHEATKGMVTFMVSPQLALQEEQVNFKVGIQAWTGWKAHKKNKGRNIFPD